jgi:hypothetical protein
MWAASRRSVAQRSIGVRRKLESIARRSQRPRRVHLTLSARATAFPLSVELDRFFDFILTSPHMDLLREYSTTTTRIGHGRRIGSVRVPDNGRRG